MQWGAERNKVILLGVLTAVAGYSVYTQWLSGTMTAPERAPRVSSSERSRTAPRVRRNSGAEEPLDPMTVDPTLRTDLLAKVRSVVFEGVERDLFRFGERKKAAVAPPPAKEVTAAQNRLRAAKAKLPKQNSPVARKRSAPAIPWKYYGFANSSRDARKRAFLIGDEDQVFIATEGDVFQKRYRIVRIGVNSIVIEDLQWKDRQTLPLEQG